MVSPLQFTLGKLNFRAKCMGRGGNTCGENETNLFSVPRNGHLEDLYKPLNPLGLSVIKSSVLACSNNCSLIFC